MLQIIKNSLSHFSAKNDSPLKDGAEARIEFDMNFVGGLPLSVKGSLAKGAVVFLEQKND